MAEPVKRTLEGQTGEKDVSDAKRQVVLATKDTIKRQIEYYLSDKNLKGKTLLCVIYSCTLNYSF